MKTLVVDDHQAARSGLISLFKGTTIEVTETAADGEEALQKLGSGGIDVALVDVQMKKMDGLMLLSSIRHTSPELPVVLMSAYDYPVYMARAVAIGAQDFVLKSDPI
ncbi:MAG: response regulator, partial [Planctomycetota bacterium]